LTRVLACAPNCTSIVPLCEPEVSSSGPPCISCVLPPASLSSYVPCSGRPFARVRFCAQAVILLLWQLSIFSQSPRFEGSHSVSVYRTRFPFVSPLSLLFRTCILVLALLLRLSILGPFVRSSQSYLGLPAIRFFFSLTSSPHHASIVNAVVRFFKSCLLSRQYITTLAISLPRADPRLSLINPRSLTPCVRHTCSRGCPFPARSAFLFFGPVADSVRDLLAHKLPRPPSRGVEDLLQEALLVIVALALLSSGVEMPGNKPPPPPH